MRKIKYIGVFFDFDSIYNQSEISAHTRLYKIIKHPHVTFEYMPLSVPTELFGTEVEIKVTGYGCDGKNEAVSVEFVNLPDELALLAKEIKVPHITLSVAEGEEAVNSSTLTFTSVTPFFFKGIFGGMAENGKLFTEKI